MRPPTESQIPAPEFPAKMDWLNVAFLRMAPLLQRGPVLIEFFDTARINSHRTLPYVSAWHERYSPHGLRVIGVHSPGYSFGRDREVVERAVHKLGIEHAVLLDPDFEVWRLYGNEGWPGRYLFDTAGHLRYIHYGEGDYLDAERAIGEVMLESVSELDLPEPLAPVRPEDAEGVLLEAQTADVVLPADRERLELVRDWTDGHDFIEAKDTGGAASIAYDAGDAYAVLSGPVEPGLYETGGEVVAEEPGLRLHGFQFTPRAPAS